MPDLHVELITTYPDGAFKKSSTNTAYGGELKHLFKDRVNGSVGCDRSLQPTNASEALDLDGILIVKIKGMREAERKQPKTEF